ncbi:MAG: SDR family oxidoreductase [Sulfuricaulis sp.]|nr:SDR family oxidoreductase [Sulfuricaulis sp.]
MAVIQRLAGSVAVVTGAARGIGRSIAERFAAEGAQVACLDINPKRIAEGVAEMRAAGYNVHPYTVDVSRRDDVHAAMQKIEADLGGPVSILVNNAVAASYQPIEEIDEASMTKMFSIGLNGIIWGIQAAVPQMKRHGSGSIINLSSAAAIHGSANMSAYCALKAGVAGLTRAAAVELAPHRIRVNAIAPGMIATPASIGFFDKATLEARTKALPLGRFGEPEEMAGVAAFLASADSSYVTGVLLSADGGSTIAGT